MYDVIIIGGGPAGLTAALFCGKRDLNTLLISPKIGGQAADAPIITNYPGFEEINGKEFVERVFKQVLKTNVGMVFEEVVEVGGDEIFTVKTNAEKSFEGRSLIIACGKIPRKLNVKGEEGLLGKGVSYCATCDGPLYRGKIVAVVGGGNSAVDSAIYLSSLCEKVFLIHRRKEFRAFEESVKRLMEKENVEFVLDSVVEEIKGNKKVESIVVRNVKTNGVKEIPVDGVFIEIGSELQTGFLKDFVKLDEKGQVVIDVRCRTFHPNSDEIKEGVFAAGDVTNIPFKQIVIAAGHGAIAALGAYEYLKVK